MILANRTLSILDINLTTVVTKYIRGIGSVLSLILASSALAQPVLPDRHLTPGVALTGVSVEQICQKGYANVLHGGARNVPESEKRLAFIRYFGSVPKDTRDYEVDHLIPLCLGGSNSISNLWPQSGFTHPWNFHVKDRLEDKLYHNVQYDLKANGPAHAARLLKEYQDEISSDWTNCYIKYLGFPDSRNVPANPDHLD